MTALKLSPRWAAALAAALIILAAGCEPPTATPSTPAAKPTTAKPTLPTSPPSDACSKVLGVTCSQFDEAYVKSSTPAKRTKFGFSVALSGDTLAVGVPLEGDSTAKSGVVYIFIRKDNVWSRQARIEASNAESNDWFGRSLALSGNTLAVGAPDEDSNARNINPSGTVGSGTQADNSQEDSGAVYVFTRSGSTWNQKAYIKASNSDGLNNPGDFSGDSFGFSIALSGSTLAVGAPGEDSNAVGINPLGTSGSGTRADNSKKDSGAVYVFTRSGSDSSSWSQQAYIKASNTDRDDRFGTAVALSGNTLAVGAVNENNSTGRYGDPSDNRLPDSGAVYVFTRSGITWSQERYLKASNPGEDDKFGGTLALSGDTLAVGAENEDSSSTGIDGSQGDDGAKVNNSGAVYVFNRSGTVWNQTAYIKASDTLGYEFRPGRYSGMRFGSSIALSGDTLAIGAENESSKARGINGDENDKSMLASGAVYLFTRLGSTWNQKAYIKASNTDPRDQFGNALALSGNTLAVGAPNEQSNAVGVNGKQADNSIQPTGRGAGAVYVRRIAP